jgi:hypothetical protein
MDVRHTTLQDLGCGGGEGVGWGEGAGTSVSVLTWEACV